MTAVVLTAVAAAARAHAKLSASGAKKWLTCTPSANLEEQFPDEQSAFAEEGSFAHAVAEHRLNKWLDRPTPEFNEAGIQGYAKWYSADLSDHVNEYVEYVRDRITQARLAKRPCLIFLEQRVDYSRWVREGFGTSDVIIVTDEYIESIDLKFGKGVQVSAIDNPQPRLYSLGAWNDFNFLFPTIERVISTIVQPRLGHISTEELSADELLRWADDYVKPRATLAWDGLGEFVPGEHCASGFCRARFTCAARAEANMAVAKSEFALQPPELLTMEQLTSVLERADEAIKWLSDVQTYALQQAEQGHPIAGWKLVEGRANRKYANADEVAKRLVDSGIPEAVIYERSLLGITAMEKALGKKQFGELLGDLVVKPTGKPTLVPAADKRPALSSVASAAEDFS